MEKPYRYKKKLMKVGNSKYALIPAVNGWAIVKNVYLEVYKDKIVITKAKGK